MRTIVIALALLTSYLALVFPLSQYLRQKPFLEKVGYIPQPFIMKAVAGDQKNIIAAGVVLKVLNYYGGLLQDGKTMAGAPPDHQAMQASLTAATRLDPYNMDTYYFAQAMAGSLGSIEETNALLEYGMRHRDWDFYLPFFAGFNYAYHLGDYAAAADHYATAQRLSGADLFGRLASRYLYESGQTEMALNYLAVMIENSRNEAIRRAFELRRAALLEVRRIELARDRFRQQFGRLPASLQELYSQKLLAEPAIDPYGGDFYLDEDGTVRSTSKFAAAGKRQ